MFQTTRDTSLDTARPPDHESAPRPVAFELTRLSKVYHRGKGTEVRAVDDLSLAVPVGQVVGLLGPNGAGKTTTIKMMCGLVTPTSGCVHLNGYDVARERPMAVRQVGAVLEGARNVYWSLSAWQNLLYFGRLKGLSRRLIVPRAESLLRSLDLWKQRHQAVGGYSRGMQQKVAIAAALITTLGVQAMRQVVLQGQSLGSVWADGTLPWLLIHAALLAVLGWLVFLLNDRRARRLGTLL